MKFWDRAKRIASLEIARTLFTSHRKFCGLKIRSVGGGARSNLWNQIKADVLGLPVLLPETSVGAPFGDAVLVGMGTGHYSDVSQTLREVVRIRTRYEPNLAAHRRYTDLYGVFRSIYEHLRSDFDQLAAIDDYS